MRLFHSSTASIQPNFLWDFEEESSYSANSPMQQTVVSWDNHNQAIEGAGPYEILDIAPKTASQNRHRKAQLEECDYPSPPPSRPSWAAKQQHMLKGLAQEPNKTHAVPEPSMGEGTANVHRLPQVLRPFVRQSSSSRWHPFFMSARCQET